MSCPKMGDEMAEVSPSQKYSTSWFIHLLSQEPKFACHLENKGSKQELYQQFEGHHEAKTLGYNVISNNQSEDLFYCFMYLK